jgi:hypothetical protein
MTEFKMNVILLGFSVKFVWRNCSSSLLGFGILEKWSEALLNAKSI